MSTQAASISNTIAPWCDIAPGKRWAIQVSGQKRTIVVKEKSELAKCKAENLILARNFECMRETLAKAFAQDGSISTEENRKSLKQLKRVIKQQYNRYCNRHHIICRLLELFLGIFRGYSYRRSYHKLMSEIEHQIARFRPHTTFRTWEQKNLLGFLRPGALFTFVRVQINRDPLIIEEFSRKCVLDESSPLREQYDKYVRDIEKEIVEIIATHQASPNECKVIAEQVNFSLAEKNYADNLKTEVIAKHQAARKENDHLKEFFSTMDAQEEKSPMLQAVVYGTSGTHDVSQYDHPSAIYEGWARNKLRFLTLPRGNILDDNLNFVLPEFNNS